MRPRLKVKCSDEVLYQEMLRILDQLIAFDTTSHLSNLDLIGFVQERLSSSGIASELALSPDGTKANLIATVGRSGGHGIIWWGHTDVVPVENQHWTTPPFELRIRGDRAYGRGTADMKGFIACCLAVLTMLDHSSLAMPITLVLTYDEEVGCVGAHRLTDRIGGWAEDSLGCIVGEPSGLAIVLGHKGKQNYLLEFTGEPRHAAFAPQLPNPIVAAAELIGYAEELNRQFRDAGPHDDRFPTRHSWVNVGRIEGGVKPNIVPDRCRVELEIRTVPSHSCDEVGAWLQRRTVELLAAMRVRVDTVSGSLTRLSNTPSFAMDETHAFVGFLRQAWQLGDAPGYVSFGTEAGLIWGTAGIPTVVCGPGEIAQAHAPDEWVSLDQLGRCLAQLCAVPATIRSV